MNTQRFLSAPAERVDQAPAYFELQATWGITKHLGGTAATDELVALCHIDGGAYVLYVGSGIGVGPASIARRCGRQPIRCHAS